MAERITKERLKWIADHPHAIDVLASEASELARELLAYRESGALGALNGVLPYMEAAEEAGLVGDEGCHWPVELVRAAIKELEAIEK